MDSTLPKPIEPVYPDLEVNTPIELCKGDMEIRCDGYKLQAPGWLRVHFLPSPETRFELETTTGSDEDIAMPSNLFQASKLFLPNYERELGCLVTSTSSSKSIIEPSPHHLLIGGILSGSAATSEAIDICKLHFPIVNLKMYYGNFIGITNEVNETHHSRQWSGRMIMKVDGWRITIDSRDNCSEILKALKDKGGFGITHNGMIEREDQEPFRAKDAVEITSALNYFMSFWCGLWCGAVVPIGYNANGKEVWRQLHVGRMSPWRRECGSWFSDRLLADEQGQAFSGFWKLWQDQDWSDTLKVAIHWYIESNCRSGGMEGALVLAHTALEMLSSVISVEQGKYLSSHGFERLPSSDRTRVLMNQIGASLEIPSEASELRKVSSEFNWHDGPEVIAQLRNCIVHPNRKNREKINRMSNLVRHEAWQLALEYISLVLLKQCEYNGRYQPRMAKGWAGAVEKPVPWVEKSTHTLPDEGS